MKHIHTENTYSMKAFNVSLTHLLLLTVVSMILGAILGYLLIHPRSTEIVHIRSEQVFHSFSLKKELETKLNNTRQSREQLLQNLAMRIQRLQTQGSPADSVRTLEQEYITRQEAFSVDNETQAQEYDTQIWTQLNQYIQDFCSQNGYAYVLGSTGVGNLMGADPNNDVTELVIAYVNERYSGKI